jgi:DNA-binding PadR family transcriptional regulator
MRRKLRVFLSSTMKDLANERLAVRQRLSDLDLEPVNAEGWGPNGSKSWTRIQGEIESSDLFVLILGERYGWIPDIGPGAGSGLSVTHLEFREARRLQIPVLPFLKHLSYDTDRLSEDAQRRDQFRREVTDWAEGQFVAEFELAPDLAAKVGRSLIELLVDEFQARQIKARLTFASMTSTTLTPSRESRDSPQMAVEVRLAGQRFEIEREVLRVLAKNSGRYLRRGYIHERLAPDKRPTPTRLGQILADLSSDGLINIIHGRGQGNPRTSFYALSHRGLEVCRTLKLNQEETAELAVIDNKIAQHEIEDLVNIALDPVQVESYRSIALGVLVNSHIQILKALEKKTKERNGKLAAVDNKMAQHKIEELVNIVLDPGQGESYRNIALGVLANSHISADQILKALEEEAKERNGKEAFAIFKEAFKEIVLKKSRIQAARENETSSTAAAINPRIMNLRLSPQFLAAQKIVSMATTRNWGTPLLRQDLLSAREEGAAAALLESL